MPKSICTEKSSKGAKKGKHMMSYNASRTLSVLISLRDPSADKKRASGSQWEPGWDSSCALICCTTLGRMFAMLFLLRWEEVE